MRLLKALLLGERPSGNMDYKMPQLQALLMCDTVVIAPDGKIQLQGIFDQISTVALPASHRMAWLYFRFLVDKPKASHVTVHFSINRPNGVTETMADLKVPVALDGKAEGNVALQNLPLHSAGYHTIDLFVEEEKIGSYRFLVELIRSQAGGMRRESVN